MNQNPILKEVWEQYAAYDYNAVGEQVKFKRVQNWILSLGVTAVLLALVQTQLFGVGEVAEGAPTVLLIPNYYWYQILRWGIIIAPILIAALIALSNQFKSGNKWIMLRSGAESLKREMFRYRAQAGIYSDASTQQQKLADKLTQIRRQVMKTSVSESSLKPHGKAMPSDMGFLTSSGYIDSRLEDQRKWYTGKTGDLEKKLRALQILTILIGGLGTLLAAVGAELWVALTTALAAAFVTYLEFTRTEDTLVLYNQVATDLKNILTWWNALSSDEQALPSNHGLLVQQTEQALESEHSGWVQNMTEALTELQEQQAAMKEQVQADVEAVFEQAAVREEALAALKEAEEPEREAAEPEPPEPEEGAFDQEDTEEEIATPEIATPEIAPPAPTPSVPTPSVPTPAAPEPPAPTPIHEAEGLKGFHGDLAWVHAREGHNGHPYWPGGVSGVTLDPGMDLGHAKVDLIEGLYGPRLKAEEMAALRRVYGIKGDKAKAAITAEIKAISISRSVADAIFPVAARPYWDAICNRFATLKDADCPGSVQTVFLSLAYNRGAGNKGLNSLKDSMDTKNWAKVADIIGNMQQDHKLEGIRKRRRMEADLIRNILKRGSRGAAVKALQKALGLTADGDFGPGTEKALKEWQAANGLPADGIAGPDTQEKLLG